MTRAPKARIVIDGSTTLDSNSPFFSSITLSDRRAGEADDVTLALTDPKAVLNLPRRGATMAVQLGFDSDLVDKGSFIIDQVSLEEPPRIITVRARSADFRSRLTNRFNKSYDQQNLGDILAEIALRQSLEIVIGDDLAGIIIDHIDQTAESDGHFLTRLAHRYGALATVKEGRLLFSPLNKGTAASGSALPEATIARGDVTKISLDIVDREAGTPSVRASFQNGDGSDTDTVTVNASDIISGDAEGAVPGYTPGSTPHNLPEVFASRQIAKSAARAELIRLMNEGAHLSLKLAPGRPSLIPEMPVTLYGFDPDIMGRRWLIDHLTHRVTKAQGYRTDIRLVTNLSGA